MSIPYCVKYAPTRVGELCGHVRALKQIQDLLNTQDANPILCVGVSGCGMTTALRLGFSDAMDLKELMCSDGCVSVCSSLKHTTRGIMSEIMGEHKGVLTIIHGISMLNRIERSRLIGVIAETKTRTLILHDEDNVPSMKILN
eukprot:scaffold284844_cov40-Tisochrysis_lutea.AAC.1